jgi:hypothetical protein
MNIFITCYFFTSTCDAVVGIVMHKASKQARIAMAGDSVIRIVMHEATGKSGLGYSYTVSVIIVMHVASHEFLL